VNITVLYCGVDTLEATFIGDLVEGLSDELDLCKAIAQGADNPESFPIDGESFFVSPRGQGKYAWVLGDPRMLIRLSRSTKPGLPTASVRLRASALASYGHEPLWNQAVSVLSKLGSLVPNTLSRIDLCCDVQGFDFTDADFERLVSPASYRAIHKDGEGVTYQVGKGDVVMRIYRKDAELKAKKKLSYARLWESHPDYDPTAPVWRIEVQLRGQVLKELQARQVSTAFSKLGKLWRFGLEWGQLRVPTEDTTKKRWPVDLAWSLLSLAWGEGEPEPRIRKAAALEREERVLSRILGAVATLGAYSGQTELIEVLIHASPRLYRHLLEQ
jgi:hypothetical protein